MSDPYIIQGQGVSKVFRDFWGRPKVRAVTDVEISVPRGAVFGLLGPNGAGKSTLIKMILGHLYPTSGNLSVFGKHPTDVESKARLGYVPERAFLYKHLTPMQTLKFFGEVLELPGDVIRARSEQLLEMVGLEHAKNRIVGEFSHGMGRRMGLAQALLNDPELLLLDEPTAGLDPLGCREVKDLILTLAKRGKTILLTSHLLADVEEVSDELLVMYGGRVQASGTSRELLAKQDMLQINMPAPSAALKQKLIAVAKEEVAVEEIEMTSPIRSLENYFLQVVRGAAETQDTFGARAGAGVASYLTTNQQDDGAVDKRGKQQVHKKEVPFTASAEAPPEVHKKEVPFNASTEAPPVENSPEKIPAESAPEVKAVSKAARVAAEPEEVTVAEDSAGGPIQPTGIVDLPGVEDVDVTMEADAYPRVKDDFATLEPEVEVVDDWTDDDGVDHDLLDRLTK